MKINLEQKILTIQLHTVVIRMDIKSDLQMLEIGFGYCKLGLTLGEAKSKYLKLIENALNGKVKDTSCTKDVAEDKNG